ncbi:hypothetical protein NMY22_g6924 [Coprinellus aureogranulatus]|nr:hypothetical protein NMY22_g6924 [Coprinellus aureogranulatus]
METEILENELSFYSFLSDVLDAVEEEQVKDEIARYRPGGRVNLNELGDTQWLEQFRFTRAQVHALAEVLELPTVIKCPQSKNEEDRVTALCMLLRRLSYPLRLADVELLLGWEKTRFSRMTRLVASIIFKRWKHLLRFNPVRLTPEKLAEFGRAIKAKGAPMDCVVGFIDGTLQKIGRPSSNQRLLYNGWKRIHCLKYHAVISPDGIIMHVFGPVDGRRHDETVYKESGLEELLAKHFWKPGGKHPLFIYGDPAYSMGPHIMVPYKGPTIDRQQRAFNTKMSRLRQSVEWVFKEMTQQFTFLDFSRSQKILLSPCGLLYLVAILLCNAHTILHNPQIPQYFGCQPPSLPEYFTGGPIEDEELDRWCQDSPWVTRDIPENEDTDEEEGIFHEDDNIL